MKKYLLLFAVAGCAQIGGPIMPDIPQGAADTCNAAQHARLVGMPIAQLETTFLRQPVRVIPPNSAVTMDFIANRINFTVSPARTITKISCG